MRICFVADGGSEIARNWMGYFVGRGHEVHLISSRPCGPDALPGARTYVVPLALMGLSGSKTPGPASPATGTTPGRGAPPRGLRKGRLWGRLSGLRNHVAAVELHRRVPVVRRLIERIAPDIVHALRIPFEGIVSAKATPRGVPLLVSVWGNDFTLFAEQVFLIGRQTAQAMRRTDALHCDCERDMRLAGSWGFDGGKPGRVLPGAGGIKTDVFHPGEADPSLRARLELPRRARVVINPRGYRAYVPLDAFFPAVRVVAESYPEVVFLCLGLEGNPIAERLVSGLGISANVRLMGRVDHAQMADLFRLAAVSVSPSLHDGTPNTLLESMACGCFPAAGDIESVREWITDGRNGLLYDPSDPRAIAAAVSKALEEEDLQRSAGRINLSLIRDRAEYGAVMRQAESFYEEVVGRPVRPAPVA